MSQKKHKQLRREGNHQNMTKCSKYEKCNLSNLRLVTRNQLLSILKWLDEKWNSKKNARTCEGPDRYSGSSHDHAQDSSQGLDWKLDDIFSRFTGEDRPYFTGLKYYIKNLAPLYSSRSNSCAVPVSLYHDADTGKCLYQIWSVEDYTSYVVGCHILTEDSMNLQQELRVSVKTKIAPQRTPVAGGVNTVKLTLGRTSELEEHLPDSGMTLNDLIWLGRHDEHFHPLTWEEMQYHVSSMSNSQLSRHYQVNNGNLVVRFLVSKDGTKYYQPEKSRLAWSQTTTSVPIHFTDKPGIALVPIYRSERLTLG
jgi:hypothetical protein